MAQDTPLGFPAHTLYPQGVLMPLFQSKWLKTFR